MAAKKSKRKKSVAKRTTRVVAVERLQKALQKQTKAELIDTLTEFADGDRRILRDLELRFDVRAPTVDLFASTRQAIADATAFDERWINYNFDYDHAAYETVERNFGQLVKTGALEQAMELCLELMDRGSYQTEMSDEGMMTEEIEDCLNIVIRALPQSDLPPGTIARWCDAMVRADRVGFVCEKELKALRKQAGT